MVPAGAMSPGNEQGGGSGGASEGSSGAMDTQGETMDGEEDRMTVYAGVTTHPDIMAAAVALATRRGFSHDTTVAYMSDGGLSTRMGQGTHGGPGHRAGGDRADGMRVGTPDADQDQVEITPGTGRSPRALLSPKGFLPATTTSPWVLRCTPRDTG